MSWFILFLAGCFEVMWAVGLKYSDGFTKLWPSVFTAITMTLSVILLALAMKTLPLGTAYAVWTGIGAIGTAIIGMIMFHDSTSFWRILCLTLIFSGIVGLKLLAGEKTTQPEVEQADTGTYCPKS